MNSRRSGDSLERAWPPAATGSGEVSVDSEFERSEDEDSNGRVRASKSLTCETSPARGSSRPEAELVCDSGGFTHRRVILKGLVCDLGVFTHQSVQGVIKGDTP